MRSPLSGLPATYWYVWGGTLINRLGSFVVPFLALYLTDRMGMSVLVAGQIAALYGLGSLFAGFAGGILADRFGRRFTLILGLVTGGVSMAGLGFASSLPALALWTFCVGFFTDLSRPAVSAIIADVVPASDRTRAYGLLHWAINIGFSLAPLIAGMLSEWSFLALFLGDAATTLLYAVLVFFKVPETRPAAATQRPALLQSLAIPLTDRAFLAFAACAFLLGLVFFQFEATLPIDIKAKGASLRAYGALIAINGLLIALLQPVSASWISRFRRSHVLAAAALLTGIGFSLPAFVDWPPVLAIASGLSAALGVLRLDVPPSLAIYAIAIVIWTGGEILSSPVQPSVAADLAPTHLRASYQGAMQVSWGLAFALAPALGTWVMHRYGSWVLWMGCLALSSGVAVGHLLIAPARRRRIAALRAQAPAQHGSSED